MPDILKYCRASMKALVKNYGCYEAVSSLISAQCNVPASKGTVSKKMAGMLEFTIADVIALEDAVGQFPVTSHLMNRLKDAEPVAEQCLLTHGANINKEAMEAVNAIMMAAKSSNADERAEALQQIDEAQHALRHCRELIENTKAAK